MHYSCCPKRYSSHSELWQTQLTKLTARYDSTTMFLSDSLNVSCMVSLKRLLLSNHQYCRCLKSLQKGHHTPFPFLV